jgi:phenylpropionate dioxygenase-like ring-hydroxylating dioxygenase large terminal subunit
MADRDAPTIGLAAARYTTQAALADEYAHLLMPSWQFVCHESDLPARGTAMRFDFGGRSAVVVRTPDMRLSALVNVCRHRGSRLVDGDAATGLAYCVDGKLRCPYHGWVYDAQGALEHVPGETACTSLDRTVLNLKPLAIESREGWVFVAFEKPARGLAEVCGDWLANLAPYRTAQMRRLTEPRRTRLAANWKLVSEDRLDAIPNGVASQDTFGCEGETVTQGSGSWSTRAYAAQLPDLQGPPPERRRRWARALVWPNTGFEISADQVIVTQVLPLTAAECVVREVTYGLPDASRSMRAARYLHRRLQRRFDAARARLVERVQAGLQTGDSVPGPLAVDEAGRGWFIDRVRSECPDS